VRVDQTLLDLLVCPQCHTGIREITIRGATIRGTTIRGTTIRETSDGHELACTNPECGLIYPVKDGIPVMLIDEARSAER